MQIELQAWQGVYFYLFFNLSLIWEKLFYKVVLVFGIQNANYP